MSRAGVDYWVSIFFTRQIAQSILFRSGRRSVRYPEGSEENSRPELFIGGNLKRFAMQSGLGMRSAASCLSADSEANAYSLTAKQI
jgi:hypothetical protein